MLGQVVGSYRVVKKLGEGGMGEIYLAEHTILAGRKAAVKTLHTELTANEEIVARFFNEANATTLIDHPCIVPVFDYGRLPSGATYFVMEYLQGESLGSRLRNGGRLPPDVAVAYLHQVVSALALAHDIGIVHRDLKPENLFLCPDPTLPCRVRVKLLDFGIAKLRDENVGGVRTGTNTLLGTPAYMSPEQCRGAGGVDHRSDIYSLGCIMFEMLVGRPPFIGNGNGEYITAHMSLQAPAPRSFFADIPPALDAVILRCLAKNPAARYQTMRDLAADLEKMPSFSASMSVPSWSRVDVSQPPQSAPGFVIPAQTMPAVPGAMLNPPPTTMGSAASEVRAGLSRAPHPQRKLILGVGLVAAVALIAGGAVALTSKSEQKIVTPSAASVEDRRPALASDAGSAIVIRAESDASPPVAIQPVDAGVPQPAVAPVSASKTRTGDRKPKTKQDQTPTVKPSGDGLIIPDYK